MSQGVGLLKTPVKTTFFVEREKKASPISMARCHYHSSYELYYLYSGERIYFIKDKTYHIKKGDLVIISPDVIHATFNVENLGYERFLLTFKKSFLEDAVKLFNEIEFFECLKEGSQVISLKPQQQVLFENIFNNLTDAYSKKGSRSQQVSFLVLQLLNELNLHKNNDKQATYDSLSNTQKTVSDMMAYINHNFKKEITLTSVAEQFFMSSCYLSRIFKKHVGLSFVEYVNNVRIKEAKLLLANSNTSVMDISNAVGFKSNTHFGRIFKEIVGVSPLKYRLAHRGK